LLRETFKLLAGAEKREAVVRFIDAKHKGYLKTWKTKVPPNPTPDQRDAYDFARSAHQRWDLYHKRYNYALKPGDLDMFVTDNPHVEVSNYVLLTCDWFCPSNVIAAAHYRRSWCNRIILDYLSVHPSIVRPPDGEQIVKGAGTALVCFIAEVADSINADMLWGEATQLSREWYQRAFELEDVKDLLVVPNASLKKFLTEKGNF